jgi:hypothetical protein
VPVPWGSLGGKETEYVAKEYLPDGFRFKEPSKMAKADVYAFLKFWFQRQEDPGTETVFEFQRIKGKDGEPVGLKVANSKGGKRKTQHGSKKPGKKAKKPAMAEEGDSSESESSSDDDEDGPKEAGDDEPLDEEDNGSANGLDDPAPPKRLPFSAVPRKGWVGASSISRKPVTKNRYIPATGPQFDPPNTRRSKKRDNPVNDEAESPEKKKRKTKGIERKGPPVGIAPDKPAGREGKRRK